jgi:palmitoyl-protein thioesterase
LLRGYLEKYNQPKMKRLVTLASPLGGFYCGKNYKCYKKLAFLNDLTPEFIYSHACQNFLGGAGYWRDPYNFDMYVEKSSSLSLLDNVQEVNETYKKNFMSLDLLVMFGSPKDGLISPWNSAWFGGFINDDKTIHNMTERFEYK